MNIKRVIAAAALAVVPLTVSSTALAAPQSVPAAAVPAQVTAEGAQYADTVLTKVNELRRSLGLQPVTRYQELDAVAQDWSEQQASTNTMDHRPNFTSAYPAGWTTGSENVAWRTPGGDTGAQIFDQWVNSPGHYQNMINPEVNSIGIGFAQASNGSWYATQNFAAYNPSNTPLTPTTTNSTPPSTSTTPPADTTQTTTTTDTPESTPSAPTTETAPSAPAAPPAPEATPETTPAPSAPTTTVATETTQTTTATGTPAKPSATPAVAAPSTTTPTKSALATTGPSIAIAVVAAGLLGTGAVLVMRRRQAS